MLRLHALPAISMMVLAACGGSNSEGAAGSGSAAGMGGQAGMNGAGMGGSGTQGSAGMQGGGGGAGAATFDATDGDGEAELTAPPSYDPETVAAGEGVTVAVPVDADTTVAMVRLVYFDSGAWAIRGTEFVEASTPGEAETLEVTITPDPPTPRDDYFAEVMVCSAPGADAMLCDISGVGRSYQESDDPPGTYMYLPFDDSVPTTRYHTGVAIDYFTVE